MATKLHVTQQEMERAYRLHKQFYEKSKPPSPAISSSLILCYAVECGLKQRLMRDRNLLDTAAATSNQTSNKMKLNHDLRSYFIEARLPAQIAPTHVKTKIRHPCRQIERVESSEYHQAFRYGVELENESELIERLEQILDALEAC